MVQQPKKRPEMKKKQKHLELVHLSLVRHLVLVATKTSDDGLTSRLVLAASALKCVHRLELRLPV